MSRRGRKLGADVQVELRRLSTAIDRLDGIAADRFGINRTDLRCLDVLTSVGPERASELAAAVGLSSGGLSIALDRLEKAGFVRRRQHADDRRGVVIEATEKAHSVDHEIFGGIEARLRRLVERYAPEELEVILRFLSETRSAIST